VIEMGNGSQFQSSVAGMVPGHGPSVNPPGYDNPDPGMARPGQPYYGGHGHMRDQDFQKADGEFI